MCGKMVVVVVYMYVSRGFSAAEMKDAVRFSLALGTEAALVRASCAAIWPAIRI